MSNEILLRLNDVLSQTGLSRSNLYRLMKKGEFPRSVPLGTRCVAWPEREVDSWTQQKIENASSESQPNVRRYNQGMGDKRCQN
jgi:prophage regulatory protein